MKNEKVKNQYSGSFQESSATYQTEKIRYTQNFTCPLPLFELVEKTHDTSGILQHQVSTASGSVIPIYVSHDTIANPPLGPPQNSKEHYLATRGILYSLPHFKRK